MWPRVSIFSDNQIHYLRKPAVVLLHVAVSNSIFTICTFNFNVLANLTLTLLGTVHYNQVGWYKEQCLINATQCHVNYSILSTVQH